MWKDLENMTLGERSRHERPAGGESMYVTCPGKPGGQKVGHRLTRAVGEGWGVTDRRDRAYVLGDENILELDRGGSLIPCKCTKNHRIVHIKRANWILYRHISIKLLLKMANNQKIQFLLCFYLFSKIIHLFLFRERGREGERKREKRPCAVASHAPPTGSPGLCPDWESDR